MKSGCAGRSVSTGDRSKGGPDGQHGHLHQWIPHSSVYSLAHGLPLKVIN